MTGRDALVGGAAVALVWLLLRKKPTAAKAPAADVVQDEGSGYGPDQGSGLYAPGEAGAAERERFNTFRDDERAPASLGAEGAAWAGLADFDSEYIKSMNEADARNVVGASGVQ